MKKTILFMIVLTLFGSLLAETAAGSMGWDERGYLVFKSDDGNFQARFDTRFYINGSYFLDDPEDILSNQTNLRKARLALKVKLWKHWAFEWDIDVAEGELVEVKDMWASYNMKNSHIKFGNFKQPLGLEEMTSSRLLIFPERAMVMSAFEADRQFGLGYTKWNGLGKMPYHVQATVFTQTLANESKSDFEKEVDETGHGAALRFATAPKLNEELSFHGGLAFVYNTPYDDSKTIDFKSEAETKNGDLEWIDTNKIKEVDNIMRYGLEGAIQYRSFHFQSEYVMTNVIRTEESTAGDATFAGGYAMLAWLLTGERRPWDASQGEFGQVIPNSNKTGAWELAARYSYLNLTDEDADLDSFTEREILGGAANIYSLGVNWYANPNVKFQLAYNIVDLNQNANSEGDYIFLDDAGNNLYPDGYDFNYLQFMTIFFF
jgi:phosphate-selective porin OprO and OprP